MTAQDVQSQGLATWSTRSVAGGLPGAVGEPEARRDAALLPDAPRAARCPMPGTHSAHLGLGFVGTKDVKQ